MAQPVPPRRRGGGKGGRARQQQQQQQRRGQRPASEPLFPTLELAEDEGEGPRRRPAPPAPAADAGGAKPAAAAPASADAASIHRWLSSGTLRTEYILTEIFQPPLSMRGERMES
jgi:hypothetical protein